MKWITKGIIATIVISTATSILVQSQTIEVGLVLRDEVPQYGTFWLAKGPNNQPLPPLPFPPDDLDVPIYALGNGHFLFDDRGFDYATSIWDPAMSESMMLDFLEGPPSPGEGGGTNSPPEPDTRRNYAKFMNQAFSLIDTNAAAQTDTNLYGALLAFPEDTNSTPTLQIAPYGLDSIIIRANHFDYSAETTRDFALLVCDKVETPVWKDMDFAGTSGTQDGWLVQGSVPNAKVTDPMYFRVSNVARDVQSTFFRAIPYGGPEIQFTSPQPYDIVSNTITVQAIVRDLSGVTNVQFNVTVDGDTARYTLGSSNTISLNTKYNPNGSATIYLSVSSRARVYNPTNAPDKAKLFFSGLASLPVELQNDTYLLWASDYCSPEIGTNYHYYVTDRPQTITGSIYSPVDGRVVKTFGGYFPGMSLG